MIVLSFFQTHSGLTAFINRLEHEVDVCRREQPFVIRPPQSGDSMDSAPASPPDSIPVPMEDDSSTGAVQNPGPSTSSGSSTNALLPNTKDSEGKPLLCFPQVFTSFLKLNRHHFH